MQKLPDQFVGALQRRLNGIIDKIENGGLEYNYAMNGLQMVSEGRVQLPTQDSIPAEKPAVTTIVGRLRLISGGKKINISATDGSETIAKAVDVFKCIDDNFRNWGTDVPGTPTGEKMPVQVFELIEDGAFVNVYGGFIEKLDKLCLSQAQIKAFCRDHSSWLRRGGYGTFFLFKVGFEFFVAGVYTYSNVNFDVFVFRLTCTRFWDAGDRHRFVFPQLTLEN